MLKLFNTMSGRVEELKTIKPNEVGMYVCGPTVYDYDHIGHARTYLSFDLLNRLLNYLQYKVKYVQNITDVGHLVGDAETGTDKVKDKAQQTGESVGDIVRHFTQSHLLDLENLRIKMPEITPKASEHIDDIISYITELITAGYAYPTEQGNVYFSVNKKPDYGKLSHRGLTEILTGTRVEPANDKRQVADFALWKAAPNATGDFVWDSPWPIQGSKGKGYPGWHIECSVMSQKYLGQTFDIHGSAVEHIFPHHENEIAQAEAKTGQPLANYWVHTGMLTINGQKMSKSSGNSLKVSEVLKQYSSNEVRLALYLTQYRKPFDYTNASMEQGEVLRRKLFQVYPSLSESAGKQVFESIITALEDDLDTPKALQLWAEHSKELGKREFEELFEILGLVYANPSENKEVQELLTKRDSARNNKDFTLADNLKDEISKHGFEVVDMSDSTQLIPR